MSSALTLPVLPIYREIAEILDENPQVATEICIEDLNPIVHLLSLGKLPMKPLSMTTVMDIYKRKLPLQQVDVEPAPTAKPAKPTAPIRLNVRPVAMAPAPQKPAPAPQKPAPAPQKPAPAPQKPAQVTQKPAPAPVPQNPVPDSPEQQLVDRLNKDHTIAASLSTEDLRQIIMWSDNMYYNLMEEVSPRVLLKDQVYDYVKRIYGQRVHQTMDKQKTMLSVSSETGVGIKPTKGRDTKLPVPLRSLDNVYMGEGDVEQWQRVHRGPYHLSAKMDGTSALYYQGVLYTRGDATVGRNISHVLPFLNLPTVPYAVRGEMVIDKRTFDRKYKEKPSKQGAIRKINRNSVAGALGSTTNLDTEFLSDLEFIAYEIIAMGEDQTAPSEQFRRLEADGFKVAAQSVVPAVSDQILSKMYHSLVDSYNYEVDGVVLRTDRPYARETEKNPDYAKAYKEALEQDVAVTRIILIEWNVSQYGYLVPTLVYEPVSIGGVTLQRATAHNAKEVQKLGLGPGAVVEIVYRAKVNPQVNRVLTPVEPDMPKVPYVWVPNDAGEPVNIKFDEEHTTAESEETMDTIRIKRIHKFLIEIEAKGLGETTVEKIYNKTGYRTIGEFINMKQEDIAFLGRQTSQNIVASITSAMEKVDLPTLMAGSKVFGRGLGVKKFTKVFLQYPDFAERRYTYQEYVKLFLTVEGFADKTAKLAAEGMVAFWEFIDTQLSQAVYKRIISNTDESIAESLGETSTEEAPSSPSKPAAAQAKPAAAGGRLGGQSIYVTGVRDPDVKAIIKRQGGTAQDSFTGATTMLIIKDADYTNAKTEKAASKGLPILTVKEFKERYGS